MIFIDGDTRMYLEDNVTPAPVGVDADEPGGPIEGSYECISLTVRNVLGSESLVL